MSHLSYGVPGIALSIPRKDHFGVARFSVRLAIATGTHRSTDPGGFCRTQLKKGPTEPQRRRTRLDKDWDKARRGERLRTRPGAACSYLHVARVGGGAGGLAVHVGEPVHAGWKLYTQRCAASMIGLYLVHRHGGYQRKEGSGRGTQTLRGRPRPPQTVAAFFLTLLLALRENEVRES